MTARTVGQDLAGQRTGVGAMSALPSPAAQYGMTGVIEDELRVLREAVEALRGQQDANEDRLRALSSEMTSMRGFREHTETELSKLRIDLSALAGIVDELAGLPPEVRAQFEPELEDVREQLQVAQRSAGETDGEQASGLDERGRPAAGKPPTAVGEDRAEEGAPGCEDEAGVARQLPAAVWTPPTFVPGEQCSVWLADAIRAIATRRSARLAGELVLELIPLHAKRCEQPLSYEVQIEELGRFLVRLAGARATITPCDDHLDVKADFRLRGSAAAFADLAAGGALPTRSRLRARGSRRKARQLFRAAERPCALADLVDASVPVWPGLLLAAMAEAIDPAWTAGARFLVAYVIEGTPGATLYVHVADGKPIGLNTTVYEASQPQASLRLSERAFLCMLAGVPLPGDEQILLSGQAEPVELLSGWFARAQGAIAAP